MSWLSLSDAEWSAVALSLRVGLWSVLAGLIPGIMMAWLLARKSFPGKTLLDAIIHLPLVVPPVATGFLLLLLLGRNAPLGRLLSDRLGWPIAFTWRGAVVASIIMGFPLLVRAVRLAFELVDHRLEQAAATLGSNPMRVWWTITLPLALPGVISGGVLMFARSLGEFGATITLAGNIDTQTRTLPLALYTFTQVPNGEAAALRLGVLSVLLCLGALLASELMTRGLRRRFGAR